MIRRSWLVYGILLAIWVVLIGWQAAEHSQVERAARTSLRHRAQTISRTLALIMRSRGPFTSQSRIEAWLKDLVSEGEVTSIKLFNIDGEELVSAGPSTELPKGDLPTDGYWDESAKTVTLMNLVDLGTNIIWDFTNRPAAFATDHERTRRWRGDQCAGCRHVNPTPAPPTRYKCRHQY